MAHYLRNTPGLNKESIGQYIGKVSECAIVTVLSAKKLNLVLRHQENEFNQRVLKAYVNLFDHQGVQFISALRSFLETFR